MKLLMVEDDIKLAATVRRGLEAEGFTVEHCDNGVDGLWRATEFAYDLIILDVMVPGRNGYQICADLRAAENWTPILMLTAKAGEYDEAEGLDTGADDYLTKPFSFMVLVARVRALVRRGDTRSRAPASVGPLRIDPATRRTWVADAEIPLTAREFDVLEFLVRRADQVVAKEQILDGVWSSEFEGDPNIVEVYVARLRRKLGAGTGATTDPRESASQPTIETLRGAGYRLCDRTAAPT